MSLEDNISYVNVYENVDVSHGTDGWELDDMTWYPEDGMACFQYERTIPGVGLELAIVWRSQPSRIKHPGWWERDRVERTFALTERDRIRLERGIDLDPVDFHGN